MAETQKVKPCQTVEELYLPPARDFALQAIPAFFETHCISVVELLHNYDWVRTLEDSGMMMQTIIQRAVLQGASFGGDLRDNKARLENLIREGTARLRDDSQNEVFPTLNTPEQIVKLADKLSSDPKGGYLLRGTLARRLRPARNANERLYQLLTILELCTKEHPGRKLLHDAVDDIISEIISIPRVIPELVGDTPDYGTRLHTYARVFLCQPVGGQFGKDQGLDLMAISFARGDLPLSHVVLGKLLTAGILSTEPLNDGQHNNELKYFRQLCRIIRACIGPDLQAKDVMPAMNARSARLATAEKIRESMNAYQQTDEKIQKLFFIENCICDGRSRYAIADLIFRYATAASFKMRFQTSQIPLTRRLHRLVELNHYALRSGFDNDQKQRMAKIFDDIAFALAEDARLFDLIAAQKGSSGHKLMTLYKLFAAGDITEGRLSRKARDAAKHYVSQSDFLSSFKAASKITGDEKKLRADLREKLKSMGVNPDIISLK